MNANKYKEAGALVVQLLEAPQMIPILNKSDVVLELFELHSKVRLNIFFLIVK
jgi:hypothetical protein